MKKNYYFALMLCTLVLGFISCEKEDDDENNKTSSSSIYGYWRVASGEYRKYINGELEDFEEYEEDEVYGVRLDKDGDFYYWEEDYYGDVETEYGGTYSYKNNKLKIYEEFDDEIWIYDVTTLTSSKMVLEMEEAYTEDGDRYRYVEKMTMRKVDIDD